MPDHMSLLFLMELRYAYQDSGSLGTLSLSHIFQLDCCQMVQPEGRITANYDEVHFEFTV